MKSAADSTNRTEWQYPGTLCRTRRTAARPVVVLVVMCLFLALLVPGIGWTQNLPPEQWAPVLPDRVEGGTDETGPDGMVTVYFDYPFAEPPAVTLTAIDPGGGVVMTLVEVTETYFTALATVPYVLESDHTHPLSEDGSHVHGIEVEPDHLHWISPEDDHVHPIAADSAHSHMYDRVEAVLEAGRHSHTYERAAAGVSSAGGGADIVAGPWEGITGPEEPPGDIVYWAAMASEPGWVPDFRAFSPHEHPFKVDKVIDHTHGLERAETSQQREHFHLMEVAETPTSAAPAHNHTGATGFGGGHDHFGGTWMAGRHDHGSVTLMGQPDLHTHTVYGNTHAHHVGNARVRVQFCWIACGPIAIAGTAPRV